MRKIALLGPNGQVGRAIQEIMPEVTPLGRDVVDLSNPSGLNEVDFSPFDAIINCAAYTQVDKAEAEPDLARAVNTTVPGILAEKASRTGAILVHFSTDYVFDGTQEIHTELERPSPLSVYGGTKSMGDMLALTHARTYDLRTSWVIGDGTNFARTMLSLARRDISPPVVDDQFGRPSFASDIAQCVAHLLEHRPGFGLYNISSNGPTTTWYELARVVFEQAGVPAEKVSPTDTESFFAGKIYAPRPRHSTLDLSKIGVTGFKPVDWRDGLATYLEGEL